VLACNRPLFIRFLDTFVSFHLRHGTSLPSSVQWPIQSGYNRRDTAASLHLVKLLNRRDSACKLSVRSLYTLESTIDIRYSCIQKHCNSLSTTFETLSTILRAFVENNVQVRKELYELSPRDDRDSYLLFSPLSLERLQNMVRRLVEANLSAVKENFLSDSFR